MTGNEQRHVIREAERWFERRGLPYFVRDNEAGVLAALGPRRLVPLLVVVTAVGAAAGIGAGVAAEDISTGVLVGAVAVGVLALGYGLLSLHLGPILRWAAGQTFGSLSWFFPLISRALPLLLLFVTFLFINAEVWQVASGLNRGMLWLTVLLFAGVAVAFLLARLPEEVREVMHEARGERLVAICADTPVAAAASEVRADAADVELTALQRANLTLVMLVSQALQVLLLAVAVFAFFVTFGLMAIGNDVILSWTGLEETTSLPSMDWLPVSNELFQVSVFLAAFSGLYFTVYAVTDETYREQFFTSISDELERAIGVEIVYREMLRSER